MGYTLQGHVFLMLLGTVKKPKERYSLIAALKVYEKTYIINYVHKYCTLISISNSKRSPKDNNRSLENQQVNQRTNGPVNAQLRSGI